MKLFRITTTSIVCISHSHAWVLAPKAVASSTSFLTRSSRQGLVSKWERPRIRSSVLSLSAEEGSESGALDFDSLTEMDCFIYSRNDSGKKKLELGVVEERALQPICAWTMDEAFDDYIEFVVDEEDRYSIDAKDVTIHSLVPEDSLSYGSRQVGGGMGPGNPHGEESELLYYIRKEALEGLEVIVKPELEIFW